MAVPSDDAVMQALQLVRGGGQVLLFAHTKRLSLAHPMGEGGRRPGEGKFVSLSAAGGGLESLGKRRKEFAGRQRPARAERAGASESLGRGEVGRGLSLDLASICLDEKDLIGSYSSDFTLQAEVARLVFSRRLDVRPLISHHFPLEQTPDAIALASRPTPDSLKIVVAADVR